MKLLELLFGEAPRRADASALIEAQQARTRTAPRGDVDARVVMAISQVLDGKQMSRRQICDGLSELGDPCVADHPEEWGKAIDAMIADRTLSWTSRNQRLFLASSRVTDAA